MTSFQIGSQLLKRTALLAVVATSLVISAPRFAAAADQGADAAYTNTMTQIQVCEAMGGEAEVTTYQTGAGDFQTYVECHGGYMDGFDCINDTVETSCEFSRLVSGQGIGFRDLDAEIKPLVEPVEVPVDEPIKGVDSKVDAVAPPIEQAPQSDDSTVQPTPEPVVDDGAVVDEPIISDGDGDATAEPTEEAGGDDIVLIDDGAIAPGVDESMSSGDESSEIFQDWQPDEIKGLPTK